MSIHELAEAMRGIETLVERMERLGDRMTETTSLLRGLTVNDVLFSGTRQLSNSSFHTALSFTVPFGGVFIWDPNGIGPISFRNAPFADNGMNVQGSGALQVGRNRALAVPMAGRELSIWTAATTGDVGVVVSARPFPPYSGMA